MDFKTITITDKSIINFYEENPDINIEMINIVFIDILKKLSCNLNNTINTSINSKILSIVSDIDKNISFIKTDIISNLTEKINQTKKEYIEDLKTQLINNILTNNEKLFNQIDKHTDNILTKTTSIINEIIPKSQDKNYIQIENCIKTYCSLIEKDTKHIIENKNNDETTTKNIINNIENNFLKMLSSIQNPILNLIQSTEQKTTNGIQTIKDEIFKQNNEQQNLTNNLNEFLNKYKNNSSIKGSVSENELYYILQSLMPSDELLNVSSISQCCDFKINRKDTNKPSILFENKDYNCNVSTDEVVKFERDVKEQKTHGIFISQKTPITYKENFQIDITNNLIHLYIPNCNYDTEKIKLAIQIIDSLSIKLKLINNEIGDNFSIDKKDIDEILQEYRNYISKKLSIQETIKTMSKQLLDQVEELDFPKTKYLLIKLGVIENENFICNHCKIFNAKNKASLSAHIRNCKNLKNVNNIDKSNNIIIK